MCSAKSETVKENFSYMKLPIKTKIATYLMIIIGGFAIFFYLSRSAYEPHLSFLAIPIFLFAILLLLLKKKWAWYGLLITTLLWLLGSLFSTGCFSFNLAITFIPLVLLFGDYKVFTGLKGKKFLLIFVILIIAFIIIGFQLDWNLKPQVKPVWTWTEARRDSFKSIARNSTYLAIMCCDQGGILQDNVGADACNPPIGARWPDHGDYYTTHIKIIKQCQFKESGYGEFEYEISRCLQGGGCRSANCTEDGCTYNF